MKQTTVGEVVAKARAILAGRVSDPRREADELYAAVVCGTASDAFLARERPIAPAVEGRLLLAAERRAAGWPQAYAAGRANFRGHWLAVDQRVLIPRVETEGLVGLVMEAVDEWERERTRGQEGKLASTRPLANLSSLPLVADIGTGSGAIAIALALEADIAGVLACDVSADALNLAIENAAALGAKERIGFRRGDLCGPLLDDRVDIVVSNPPYVASGEWAALEGGVKDYEPRLALDGGADGLDLIRRLVPQAWDALNPGGLLALETDARRARETAALAVAAGFTSVRVIEDVFSRERFVVGRRDQSMRG